MAKAMICKCHTFSVSKWLYVCLRFWGWTSIINRIEPCTRQSGVTNLLEFHFEGRRDVHRSP